MKRVYVDANVILRFLRNDDPDHSPQAAALFQKAQSDDQIDLSTSAVTLMEVFYVLVRAYKIPRVKAAALLRELLETGVIDCAELDPVMDALRRITSQRISFGDAYLAACAVAEKASVATFDHGFGDFKDVQIYSLESASRQ